MEIQIDLRLLIKMRHKSLKEYAKAIGLAELTMRMRLKEPKRLTIDECNASDEFLELPSGTTHAVINGNVMFNDINEYING